jgi:hypothetical protein
MTIALKFFGVVLLVFAIAQTPPGSALIEQKDQGSRPAAELADAFDGLGVGFDGPQGIANVRSPSHSSLAVGPNHIFQIVNSRMAIFSKKAGNLIERDRFFTVRFQPTRFSRISAARAKPTTMGMPCDTTNSPTGGS